MTPTTDHQERTRRAFDRHVGLLDGLLGPWERDYPLHLIALGEIYELSDEEGAVVDALIARLKAAFAAYKYTAADVAAEFKISVRLVHELARQHTYFGAKINRRWMFTQKQLARYVRENTAAKLRPGESPDPSVLANREAEDP